MGIRERLVKALVGSKIIQKAFQQYAWVGGYPVYNFTDTIHNINDGYVGSDDVYSIVRRIARTASMIPIKVYKVTNEDAARKYMHAVQQKNYSFQAIAKKQLLKYKGLEEVDKTNPLQELIDHPNPTYTATEFYEGAYSFRLITGNTYIHAPSLDLGVNAGRPSEMWLTPSQWTSLQVNDTWPRKIIGYRLQMAELVQIPVEEMIHIRYFNPQFSYVGNELIGLSPLRAGSKILSRQVAETDYSVNAFQNSGISGIVWNEAMRSEDVEQGALGKMKTDFYNEAAGTHNARKLLFMAGKMGYTQIGLSPVDMLILQSEIRTFKKLCNLYGVSDRLFNNDATGSENSTDIVFKDLFTNAVLPEVYAMVDALNLFLAPKFGDKNNQYVIDCDITGIPELQDDFMDMATVFMNLPVMNPMVIAKAFNWDMDDMDPNMNKYFVKQGYVPIDEAANGIVPNLPVPTPDGD